MGNANSKLYETITIGYIHNNSKRNDENNENKRIIPIKTKLYHDRLLNQPQHYGLSSQPCTPTPSTLSLPLSPYSSSSSSAASFLNNNINTLSNDLDYIDSTYYSSAFLTYNNDNNIAYENTSNVFGKEQQQKITLKDLQTMDKMLRVISLSHHNLSYLSSNIGLINTLRKLDLSNNKLMSLPESIGYLQSLESLYLGHNQLNSLPETIGYLTQLVELDISHNHLTSITPCIRYLKKLQYCILSSNQLKTVPVHFFLGLKRLAILDLSHNTISVLPAEITQLQQLKRLILEGCPILNDTMPPVTRMKLPCYTLSHSPPSLKELCARQIIRNRDYHSSSSFIHELPSHLISYLQSSTPCSLCQEPYFDTFILRGRLIERNQKWIPIEYRLCKAHFVTEQDRLLSMFSTSLFSSNVITNTTSLSLSSSSSYTTYFSPFMPYLPSLPNLQYPKKKKNRNKYSIIHPIEKKDPTSIIDPILQPLENDSYITFIANSDSNNNNNSNNSNNNDHDHDSSINTWSPSHRKKVMNKNHSGFLSLTKL